MIDQRKTLKVNAWVREELNKLAAENGLKNVSDVIGYLILANELVIGEKIRVVDDKVIRQTLNYRNNQLSLDLE